MKAQPCRIALGQGDDRGAGVDDEVEPASVDGALDAEMTARVGLDHDTRSAGNRVCDRGRGGARRTKRSNGRGAAELAHIARHDRSSDQRQEREEEDGPHVSRSSRVRGNSTMAAPSAVLMRRGGSGHFMRFGKRSLNANQKINRTMRERSPDAAQREALRRRAGVQV